MKFVADVNVPQLLIKQLIDLGHDVKESIILNSITIIREDTAISYQYPL